MSAEHDVSRRGLARVAGLLLLIAGASVALTGIAGGLAVFGLGLVAAAHAETGAGGYYALAAGGLVGGLVVALLGAGKAAAGWILVKPDARH